MYILIFFSCIDFQLILCMYLIAGHDGQPLAMKQIIIDCCGVQNSVNNKKTVVCLLADLSRLAYFVTHIQCSDDYGYRY